MEKHYAYSEFMRFKVGDTCYFLVSNSIVKKGEIRSTRGAFYLVKHAQGAAIKLSDSRLFKTEEEAAAAIPKTKKNSQGYRSPYDYE